MIGALIAGEHIEMAFDGMLTSRCGRARAAVSGMKFPRRASAEGDALEASLKRAAVRSLSATLFRLKSPIDTGRDEAVAADCG